jgi:hypothetical protein
MYADDSNDPLADKITTLEARALVVCLKSMQRLRRVS